MKPDLIRIRITGTLARDIAAFQDPQTGRSVRPAKKNDKS